MPGRRFILQVGGRPQRADLDHIADLVGRVRLSTVLHAVVRDQAALQGLLRRIHDLGLSLVEVHEAFDSTATEGDPKARLTAPSERVYEVTVDGPVGALAEGTFRDYIEVTRLSTLYTFSDPVPMGEVLTRLLARGAELEHARELPDGVADPRK